MGSGGKTDPSKIKMTDIAESNHCKFAYIVRKYLHRQGIREGIRVVYSPEPVKKDAIIETDGSGYKDQSLAPFHICLHYLVAFVLRK
jgi:tRNA A37 threonylcarbamoyladenosine dehydratase